MAIYKKAALPADTGRLSFAAWFRYPQATIDDSLAWLMEWGEISTDDGPNWPWILVNFVGLLDFQFFGANPSHSYTISGTPLSNGTFPVQQNIVRNKLGDPSLSLPTLAGDAWHWVGLSFDTSGASQVVLDSSGAFTSVVAPGRLYLSIDDVDFSAAYTDPAHPLYGKPVGSILPYGPDTNSPGLHPSTVTWPGWAVKAAGLELGIPILQVDAVGGFNGLMEFGNVQLWLNKTINFSDSADRRNFIDSGGGQVAASVAAAAYGTPYFQRKGGTTGAVTGSGAPFTKIGTIVDYSPAPHL